MIHGNFDLDHFELWLVLTLGNRAYLVIHLFIYTHTQRVPQSMEIQYSRANIKGDMSNFMKK